MQSAGPNLGYEPERYWTDVAERIERRGAGNVVAGDGEAFHVYRRRKFLRDLISRMEVRDRSVLEVGSGPGGNLMALLERKPRELTGADLSPKMIELARRNTAGTGIRIEKSNETGLPFPDRAFDVAFTATVLQHNVDDVVLGLMREMARVTRERIHLFEETSPVRREIFSHVSRPPAFYEQAMLENGFRMVGQDYLRDFATRVSTGLARRVFSGNRGEGETKSGLATGVERLLVGAMSPLDDLLPVKWGLTAMVFERIRPA